MEVSAYLDAAIAVTLAMTAGGWTAVLALVMRRLRRPRAVRTRPARRPERAASNDDDPAPALRAA